ncbi:hypothetical protein [Oceanicola sp. S124]|uniref:hypothetical protein n=1 Tax=Oceanicola sp. S124 TaxID=1042378 RepID=UPI0002557957|nr:hypothetical protein [Oceanicola sp. S124]
MSILSGGKSAAISAGFICAALAGQAQAQDASINASVTFGVRHYFEDGLYANQSDSGPEGSLELNINGSQPLGTGQLNFDLSGLVESTGTRNMFNPAELNYSASFGNWSLLAGYHTENWGVAESRSVMNVMNPTNNADPMIEDSLLGTPMVNLNYSTAVGTFSAYALLGFTEPTYADGDGARFRSPLEWDSSRAEYEESENERKVDLALRYSGFFDIGGGSLDLQATYFNGTSREAVGLPGCVASFGTVTEAICNQANELIKLAYEAGLDLDLGGLDPDTSIIDDILDLIDPDLADDLLALLSNQPVLGVVPYYQKVEQFGLSGVYAINDLQLRFEASHHETSSGDYLSAVVGGDYTFNNFFAGKGDLTVAVEYLYDDRSPVQPLTVFENDVFLGLNYRFNNTNATELKMGVFHDIDSQARLYTLGLSTRLTDATSIQMNATHVDTNGFNDPLAFIDNDSFLELKFTSYF